MCNALDIIREKGNEEVVALPPEATVLEAANRMNDRHIGSVLVMEEASDGDAEIVGAGAGAGAGGARLLGIFTERDVLRRIVGGHRDSHDTLLREVMTTPVACALPHTTVDEMRLVMRNRRIRHLPVVDDDGRVLGMVSIGDLNRAEKAVHEQTIHYLEQYISVA